MIDVAEKSLVNLLAGYSKCFFSSTHTARWKINTTLIITEMHPCHEWALICSKASGPRLFIPLKVHPLRCQAVWFQSRLRQGAAQVGSQVSGCSLGFRHQPDRSPSGPSAHELRIALCTRYYDIHPDPHGLRGRGHHIVKPVMSFHAEGQRWSGALWNQRGGGFYRAKTESCTCCFFQTFFRTTKNIKMS